MCVPVDKATYASSKCIYLDTHEHTKLICVVHIYTISILHKGLLKENYSFKNVYII